MITKIEKILKSAQKNKEKVNALSHAILAEPGLIDDIFSAFLHGSSTEKGNCIEALEYVSQTQPGLGLPYLDFVTKNVINDLPRIRWEACRIIANIAPHFPKQLGFSIPNLRINTHHKGVVVRWSAACALTEIFKHNPEANHLQAEFERIQKDEKKQGVRKIYLNALG